MNDDLLSAPDLQKIGYTSPWILDENNWGAGGMNEILVIKKPDAYFCIALYAVKEVPK